MEDRFGPLPEQVKRLFEEAGVRLAAERVGIRKIQLVEGALALQVRSFGAVERALRGLGKRVHVVDERSVHIMLRAGEHGSRGALELLKKCLHTR
jgi:transcription-repair coupling factor (superfamily II helicase)